VCLFAHISKRLWSALFNIVILHACASVFSRAPAPLVRQAFARARKVRIDNRRQTVVFDKLRC